MGRGGFKELIVWQKSKDLAVDIYKTTGIGHFTRDYSLRDQMRRAAISIPSNIAEGDQRGTDREAVRYFYIAKASSAELMTQAIIAHEVGYIDAATHTAIQDKCIDLTCMLSKLISSRTRSFRKQ